VQNANTAGYPWRDCFYFRCSFCVCPLQSFQNSGCTCDCIFCECPASHSRGGRGVRMRVRDLSNRSHLPWRCNPLRFWEAGRAGAAGGEGLGDRGEDVRLPVILPENPPIVPIQVPGYVWHFTFPVHTSRFYGEPNDRIS